MATMEREVELEHRALDASTALARIQRTAVDRTAKAVELEQKVALLEVECASLNQELQDMEARVRRGQKKSPEEANKGEDKAVSFFVKRITFITKRGTKSEKCTTHHRTRYHHGTAPAQPTTTHASCHVDSWLYPFTIFFQNFDETEKRTSIQQDRCIPYRLAKDDEGHCINLEKQVEVLMVSSPNRDDMVFPKGGWEDDETIEEAACREALEEAGVRGTLKETLLGVWEFRSKSNQEVCSPEGGCKGYMFALEVTEELDDWPEQNNRDRKWLLISEALKVCRYEWMWNALEKFMGVILGEKEKREDEMSKEEEEVLVVEVQQGKHRDPVPVVSDVVVVVEEDQESQIMPTNCHIKPSNTPMNTSFGIVLPAGIFL